MRPDQFRLSLCKLSASGSRSGGCWRLFLSHSLALPILLMGLLMANEFAGAMFGPPAIWNRPWQTPPRKDLVGNYMESERHLDDSSPPATASLSLQADGSMTVGNLPANFGTSTCILSGTGSWKVPDDDGILLSGRFRPTSWLMPIRFVRKPRVGRPFKAVSLVLDSWRP